MSSNASCLVRCANDRSEANDRASRRARKLGFNDWAFARLHHFRINGKRATIHAHRKYCEGIASFQGGGENEVVQRRLELVIDAYRKGGFQSGRSDVFAALADASFHELPPPGSLPNENEIDGKPQELTN